MNFLEQIKERAKSDIKRIVLPESGDIRTIKAAAAIQKEGIAKITLIGNKEEIYKLAGGLDLTKTDIIDHTKSEMFEDFANTLYEMRKLKGVSADQAREMMRDPLYFGVMMVKKEWWREPSMPHPTLFGRRCRFCGLLPEPNWRRHSSLWWYRTANSDITAFSYMPIAASLKIRTPTNFPR
jgi:hypothetical protein